MCVLTGACASLVRHPAAPDPVIPAAWEQRPGGAVDSPSTKPWWLAFGDAELDDLIRRALAGNADLARTAVRLEFAGIDRSRAGHQTLPTPTASASASISRPLQAPPSQQTAQIGGVNYSLPSAPGTSRSYSLALNLNYELDVWSRLASLRSAAGARAGAASADLEAARRSLTLAIARHYWHVAALDRRIAISDAQVSAASEALPRIQARTEAGKSTPLELLGAQSVLQQSQGERDALVAARREELYQIALLLGEAPEQFDPPPARMPSRPLPAVPAGLPVSVLDRRADLQAARLRLDAALRDLDSAEAARYPQLTITAGVDTFSESLGQFLANPVGSLNTVLGGPFLDWKARRLDRDAKAADYEDAVIEFRAKLYEALKDVEVAFGRHADIGKAIGRAEQEIALAKARSDQLRLRYALGVSSRHDWSVEQGKARNAESLLVQKQAEELDNWIDLRKALGGT